VENLARILIILEMLLINLLTTHMCAQKKFSNLIVIAELTLFTVIVSIVSYHLNLRSYGSDIFILVGFLYILPLKHLYNENLYGIVGIVFFSWIHTITVIYTSEQIAKLLGAENILSFALLVQTLFFLFSTPVVIKFVKNRFLYILRNISQETYKYLIFLGMILFSAIVVIHLSYKNGNPAPSGILAAIILIAITATASYQLIYIIVRNSKSIDFLKHIAYSDYLTGINNRLALFLDGEELIARHEPFTIIFMDLDSFKRINDTYGHAAGDEYLKNFTKATKETLDTKGSMYRISGDEFICIYKNDKIHYFIATFEERIKDIFEMGVPFLGVSIGYAKFPKDAHTLDQLINKADKMMYQVKHNKF